MQCLEWNHSTQRKFHSIEDYYLYVRCWDVAHHKNTIMIIEFDWFWLLLFCIFFSFLFLLSQKYRSLNFDELMTNLKSESNLLIVYVCKFLCDWHKIDLFFFVWNEAFPSNSVQLTLKIVIISVHFNCWSQFMFSFSVFFLSFSLWYHLK